MGRLGESPRRALEPNQRSLAEAAARKMAERTQALLSREAAASLPGGPGRLPPKMQAVMAKLDENAQRSHQLLQAGRDEAAYLEATEYACMHSLLDHLFVGLQRVAQSGSRADGVALAALRSRTPEARGQLERMHQELQEMTPKMASQLVALPGAEKNGGQVGRLRPLAERPPRRGSLHRIASHPRSAESSRRR